MSDSNRIGPSNGGVDLLKQVIGVGQNQGRRDASGGAGGALGGGLSAPRGMRMLPADYPLEALDKDSPRGTYLDILV